MLGRSMQTRPRLRVVALLAAAAAALALSGCTDKVPRSKLIEELQRQVAADRERLRVDAETRDPTRTNLKATYVETSVMGLRPTKNPERPYVGFVRIQWRFDYKDGRPLGDAVFDYVYARTDDARWVKADDAEIPPDLPRPPGGTDKAPVLPLDSSQSPAPA